MENVKCLFEGFAQDLLKDDDFAKWIDTVSDFDSDYYDNPDEELEEWLLDYDCGVEYVGFLANEEPLTLTLSFNKKELLFAYLNHYYDATVKYYDFWENEYGGFGESRRPFNAYNPNILALCVKYFESIKETDKANISCFFIMCRLCFSWIEEDEEDFSDYGWHPHFFYKTFDYMLHSTKQYIYADWLRCHPMITWSIGRYYLSIKNYRKAREYFSLGASLDYDGRQSIEPFIAVGMNQFELGMTYYKGLGVKVNAKKALECFENAAENVGLVTIPAIQDMRNEGLLPVICNPDEDILYGYGQIERNSKVYFNELNADQFEMLKNATESELKQEPDFPKLVSIYRIYLHRLHDNNKAEEVEKTINEYVTSIPVEERTNLMDRYYVSFWKKEWKKSAEKPKKNSGVLPKNPKPGDTFFFGTFNSEPIEWKVLEIEETGEVYVTTKKVLVKMDFKDAIEWMNTDFLENVFSDDEKKHIAAHDYPSLQQFKPTYIYIDNRFQREELKDKNQTIEETDTAKSMSKNKGIYDGDGFVIRTNEDDRCCPAVSGIRPAMDIIL